MILKLKIKKNTSVKKNQIEVWVQKNKDIEDDIQQLFNFFGDQLTISKTRRILPYYKVSSDKAAILWSFFTTLQEIIPEIYFKNGDSPEFEESINS